MIECNHWQTEVRALGSEIAGRFLRFFVVLQYKMSTCTGMQSCLVSHFMLSDSLMAILYISYTCPFFSKLVKCYLVAPTPLLSQFRCCGVPISYSAVTDWLLLWLLLLLHAAAATVAVVAITDWWLLRHLSLKNQPFACPYLVLEVSQFVTHFYFMMRDVW